MKIMLRAHHVKEKWEITFPEELREKIYKALDKARGRCELEIFDRKPRTTGDLSQNHKVAYLCNLIAGEANKPGQKQESYQSVKDLAKLRAIKRGYPFRWADVTDPNGKSIKVVIPAHESDISTVEAMHLIDELEFMAAEMGIETAV